MLRTGEAKKSMKEEYVEMKINKKCFNKECQDYDKATEKALTEFFNDPQNNDAKPL